MKEIKEQQSSKVSNLLRKGGRIPGGKTSLTGQVVKSEHLSTVHVEQM